MAGSAGHESLAHYFRTGKVKEALEVLEAEYREWSEEEVSPEDRLSWQNVLKVQTAWFDEHPINKLPFEIDPDLIEIGFACPLTEDGKIVFIGKMDGLVRSVEDRKWYLLENKFTGRVSPAWMRQFKVDSQLSGYTWAGMQHLGEPIVGAFLNAIEHSKLPSDPVRRCARHGVTYSECGELHLNSQIVITQRTKTKIVEWKKTALHLAKRYMVMCEKWGTLERLEKVRQQGRFTGACMFCDFYDFCALDRRPELVESMLVHDPWSPFPIDEAIADSKKLGAEEEK